MVGKKTWRVKLVEAAKVVWSNSATALEAAHKATCDLPSRFDCSASKLLRP